MQPTHTYTIYEPTHTYTIYETTHTTNLPICTRLNPPIQPTRPCYLLAKKRSFVA